MLVLVPNPVDPLVTWMAGRLGLDPTRLIGYTRNDLLRTGVARALGVPVARRRVDGGRARRPCVPAWDRVAVDGEPVALGDVRRGKAERFLRTWYVRHVALDSGRTSTWTSGLGVAEMVRAVVRDGPGLWPASVVLEGE